MNFLESVSLKNIIFLAFFIRIITLIVYPDQNFPDANAYREIGHEIFNGSTISNDIYMPLYPILAYVSGSVLVQKIVDIVISCLMIVFIYRLSFHIFKSKNSALLAALVSAIYPHFLFYSVSGLTEIFFTTLVLIAFYFLYKKNFLVGCFFLIISVLVKPTFDLLNPILIILFSYVVHSEDFFKVLKRLGAYLMMYILLISPWWIHQYNKYDEFVRLSLGDGVVLYSGNNPLNKSGGGIVGKDVDMKEFLKISDPLKRNEKLKNEAIIYIKENPIAFLNLSIEKFIRFWRIWPYAEEYKSLHIIVVSVLSFGSILVLSLLFLFKITKQEYLKISPILTTFVYLTLVHMITIGSIRYRFPLEPFMIIFSGYTLSKYINLSKWRKLNERL